MELAVEDLLDGFRAGLREANKTQGEKQLSLWGCTSPWLACWEAWWPEGQLGWGYLGIRAVLDQRRKCEIWEVGTSDLRELQRRGKFEVSLHFYVYECFVCVHVCAPHLCLVSVELDRGYGIPWTAATYRPF